MLKPSEHSRKISVDSFSFSLYYQTQLIKSESLLHDKFQLVQFTIQVLAFYSLNNKTKSIFDLILMAHSGDQGFTSRTFAQSAAQRADLQGEM